jgi:hypothetical protein
VKGWDEQIAVAAWLVKRLDQPIAQQQNAADNEMKTSNGVVWLRYTTNTPMVQQFQEIATAARTIADLRLVVTYNAPRAMVFRASADQIALTKWVLSELDKPLDAPKQHSAKDEYRVPASSDDLTRIFYLAHAETVQDFQEIATVLRTIADIRRVFTYNDLRAIAIRGDPDQIAMAEWLFERLDQPPATQLAGEFRVPKASDDLMRVFWLSSPTVADFQSAAVKIRTATGIRRLFTYNARRAIAARGTSDQLARAQKMIEDGGF